MLKSLVAVDVFSQADYDAFIGSLSTVSGQLARDRATLDKSSFLAHYGHLRPELTTFSRHATMKHRRYISTGTGNHRLQSQQRNSR